MNKKLKISKDKIEKYYQEDSKIDVKLFNKEVKFSDVQKNIIINFGLFNNESCECGGELKLKQVLDVNYYYLRSYDPGYHFKTILWQFYCNKCNNKTKYKRWIEFPIFNGDSNKTALYLERAIHLFFNDLKNNLLTDFGFNEIK